MRHYPTNSPQAAARIVALALVADGHVSQSELDRLDRLGACRQLGIAAEEMSTLLQTFCEDLLQARHSHWGDARQIEPEMLAQLMAEVDDPLLRRRVLQLCVAVVEADGHVADGESVVLVNAVEQWGLHRQMLDATAPS
ncbi:MAG: TerB family tellurite resistance protein [Burkholderiales bacterium]|nr:TerB family tellurite resistance protein [Burkholderiales bacterium]MDE2277210.1 TerB family tellurite resistance protein [Burkholderiales bacterium]